jgi:hypothetical protein
MINTNIVEAGHFTCIQLVYKVAEVHSPAIFIQSFVISSHNECSCFLIITNHPYFGNLLVAKYTSIRNSIWKGKESQWSIIPCDFCRSSCFPKEHVDSLNGSIGRKERGTGKQARSKQGWELQRC